MDLPPRDPKEFDLLFEGGRLGIAFGIDRHGEHLDVLGMTQVLTRIEACRLLIVTVALYGRWLEDERELTGTAAVAAGELRRATEGGASGDVLRALLQLRQELFLDSRSHDDYRRELEFAFVGSYLENPTFVRIFAYGSVFCMIVAATAFASVQAKQEWDAEACRARAADLAKTQSEMLGKLARMEGQWTPQHAASLQATIDAAWVASSACGSLMGSFTIKLHLPPGADFEIRLAPPPPGPSPR